jgi:integrase
MRTSKGPSYEKSKRRYVANLNNKKISLLTNAEKTKENDEIAERKYFELRLVKIENKHDDQTPIWVLLNRWLDWLVNRPKEPISPNSYKIHKHILQTFTNLHGNVPAGEIGIDHIESWLNSMSQERLTKSTRGKVNWNESTMRTGLASLRSAFLYLKNREIISQNPFDRKEFGQLRLTSLSHQRIPISESDHEKLLQKALRQSNQDFVLMLQLLWETGARPGEIAELTKEEWNEELKAFVIKASDEANVGRFKLKRLQKDRLVYVPDKLVLEVKKQLEKYPDPLPDRLGQPKTFLFRSRAGKSFNSNIMNRRFVSGGCPVSPYGYRHAFVTRWVAQNGNIKVLADLLGTSVLMIEKHYSHLFRQHDVLRNHLNVVVEGANGSEKEPRKTLPGC